MRQHILYFALHADAQAAEQVAGIMLRQRRREGPSGRPVGADGLHVSLNWVGDFDAVPDAAVSLASEAASKVVMPVFNIALNRLATWEGQPGQRPLVLYGEDGVIGVDILYEAIGKALADVGLKPPGAKPAIVAHMTLARGVAEQPLEIVRPAVGWTVRDFALVHIPPGDRRRVLQTFRLRV
jgi:2'-5' RNA ligase